MKLRIDRPDEANAATAAGAGHGHAAGGGAGRRSEDAFSFSHAWTHIFSAPAFAGSHPVLHEYTLRLRRDDCHRRRSWNYIGPAPAAAPAASRRAHAAQGLSNLGDGGVGERYSPSSPPAIE
eukprot:CAMPEP_0174913062 /NCGR_PEP_ID=MMETSP0167-20121228/80117_1 /TAXON_ID=38298 /ORGANISM="Rhodella maculata, Strain CCMP736" /LENGTH=121 /DNA_ID=CAMNT_0016157751 /DNA_START=514 /DNA_END=880 /DNA_ORIENTATION=-